MSWLCPQGEFVLACSHYSIVIRFVQKDKGDTDGIIVLFEIVEDGMMVFRHLTTRII